MLYSSVLAGDHDNDFEFPSYGINSLVIFVDVYLAEIFHQINLKVTYLLNSGESSTLIHCEFLTVEVNFIVQVTPCTNTCILQGSLWQRIFWVYPWFYWRFGASSHIVRY